MTIDEAIKYATETNFCVGCSHNFGDMTAKEAVDICDKCNHRQFFDMATEALQFQKQMEDDLK